MSKDIITLREHLWGHPHPPCPAREEQRGCVSPRKLIPSALIHLWGNEMSSPSFNSTWSIHPGVVTQSWCSPALQEPPSPSHSDSPFPHLLSQTQNLLGSRKAPHQMEVMGGERVGGKATKREAGRAVPAEKPQLPQFELFHPS